MSKPQSTPPPPPPPAQPQKKKGFSPLAWIAIGCVGLIVIGGLLSFACTAILAKKAKNFVEEAGDNPAMSAAKLIVRLNPNLDLIEKDEEAGTITIYDKEKDQTFKLSLDDVMAGNFGVETEDGTKTEVNFGQQADGSFGATITGEDGELSQVTIGQDGVRVGQDADKLPDWLPHYKGAEISTPFSVNTGGKVSGTATFSTPDSVEEVADALTKDLEDRDFSVDRTSYEAAGVTSILLGCKGPDGEELSVSVNSRGDATGVAMNFSALP